MCVKLRNRVHKSISCFRKAGAYQKGDERILAESTFVEQVLSEATGQFERKYRLAAEGFSLEGDGARVAEAEELGISQNQLAQTLHIAQPAIS